MRRNQQQHQQQRCQLRLGPQWFSHGAPLDRAEELVKDAHDLVGTRKALRSAVESESSWMMLYSRGCPAMEMNGRIAWRRWKILHLLGVPTPFEMRDDVENAESPHGPTIVLLGKVKREVLNDEGDPLSTPGWRFAIDLTEFIGSSSEENGGLEDIDFVEPRSLLGQCGHVELSVLGQAVSLLNWHQEMRFSPKSGRALVPFSCGQKRKDPGEPNRRKCCFYPRVDPVAIMLVLSPDGERILLGRTKRRHASNMFTCLSGFVEMGESAEDACRRETFEESGIVLDDEVQVLGSQCWPFGAAGHAELMIGCIATAKTEKIVMDEREMAAVKWFTKGEVNEMLQRSANSMNLRGDENEAPVVPPRFAMAHTLIAAWAEV